MSSEARQEEFCNKLKLTLKLGSSLSQHQDNQCKKCECCTCGKHICKIQPPHFSLMPAYSSYNLDYHRRRPPLQQHSRKREEQTYTPRLIISQTMYHEEFTDKIQQLSKTKPEIRSDNITIGGPAFLTTTYNDAFVKVKAEPPSPLKNPQSLIFIPGLSTNANSSYRKTFKWLMGTSRKNAPIRQTDNLKTEPRPFFGSTSYAVGHPRFKTYKKEKDNFAPSRTYNVSKGLVAKSSYSVHYCPKVPDVCPAERIQ